MMQYFGVPRCPYCNKRVNIIRTWSLKKQGEYKCPRCGGISNIFLSPLIYVFAVIAVFTGGAIFFFHRFVMDDIVLTTAIQVLIPFGCFFFLSLFTVYLKKPVINKAAKNGKKRRAEASPPAQGARRTPVAGERIPQRERRTASPVAQPSAQRTVTQPARQRMFNDDYTPAAVPPAAPRRATPQPEARRNPSERQPGSVANGRRFASEEAPRPRNPEPQRPRRMPQREMYDDDE